MADNFWNAIKKIYKQQTGQSTQVAPVQQAPRQPRPPRPIAPPPVPQVEEQSPLTIQDKEALLRDAGSKLLLVELVYKNESRLVEPYSFKTAYTGRLFYGWCSLHGKIHSFRVDRIQSVKVTDKHYAPRWEVFPSYMD